MVANTDEDVNGPRMDPMLDSTMKILLLVGCGVSTTNEVSVGVAKEGTVLLGNRPVVNGSEDVAIENGMLTVSVWMNEISLVLKVIDGMKMRVVDETVGVAKDGVVVSNVLDGCSVNDTAPAMEVVRNISSETDGVGVGTVLDSSTVNDVTSAMEVVRNISSETDGVGVGTVLDGSTVNDVTSAMEVVRNISSETDGVGVGTVLDGSTVNDVTSAMEVVRSISSETDGVGVGTVVIKALVVDTITEVERKTNSSEEENAAVEGEGTRISVDSEARLLEKVGVGTSSMVVGKGVVETSKVGCTVDSTELVLATGKTVEV